MPFVPDAKRIEVVSREVAAILRTKTPAERVAMATDAFETAWQMTTARVMTLYPEWSSDRVRAEVVRRLTRETS